MMTTAEKFNNLAERLERSSGHDRELEGDIHAALPELRHSIARWFGGVRNEVLHYTISHDAAISLIRDLSWPHNLVVTSAYGRASLLPCDGHSTGIHDPRRGEGTNTEIPRAIAAAALRARAKELPQ